MLTDIEKNYAADKLETTKEKLYSELRSLSPEQLTYKHTPEIWSIAETMEHIALAENGIWQAVKQGLTKEADESRRNEVQITDEAVYSRTSSRNFKAVSPEVIKPVGKFADAETALAFFTKRRNATIEYVQTTTDDLRNRYWKHPFAGIIDLYQTIIFLAAHSDRHIEQIIELKKNEDFPKS